MTRLIVTLQDKTLPDDSSSLSFQKRATLGHAPTDGLSGTTAKSVRSSLWSSKTDAKKIGLCLHLEMVDFYSHFGLNCVKTRELR